MANHKDERMHLPAANRRLIGPVRKDLEDARREILAGIVGTDAGRRVFVELLKSDTFTPVAKPTVLARMFRGPDGLYLGHAKAVDGKITGNARWLKVSTVGSRLLTSAGMITGHLMLVEISAKIDGVQRDIGAIRAALDDDRMQGLRAAMEGVNNALEAQSPENKYALMTATIPDLQKAIHQVIAALKREIDGVPQQKEWKLSRILVDRQPEMRSKLAVAERTLRASLEGISTLSQAYFSIGERRVGCQAATRLIAELQRADLAEAEFKARLLTPETPEDRPEELWSDVRRLLPQIMELLQLEAVRSDEHTAEFDVELFPSEVESALRISTLNGKPERSVFMDPDISVARPETAKHHSRVAETRS
jgi:hypothetical protein